MATSIVHRTATGKQTGSLSYVLSDGTFDRHHTIIEPGGWELDKFRANPVALFGHNSDLPPIGAWRNIRIEGGRLIADLEPAARGTSPRIDEIVSLIEQNLLRATSVGFVPLESEPIDPQNPQRGLRYTRQELLEASIVGVPSNPSALQIARSLNISPETMSLAFGEQAVMGRRDIPATGEQAASLRPTKAKPMNISRQIEDIQTRLNTAKDTLHEHVSEPDHDIEKAALYQGEVEDLELRLTSAQRSEKALAARLPVLEHQPPATQHSTQQRRPFGIAIKDVDRPGDLYLRAMRVAVTAHVKHKSVDDVLSMHYPDHEATAIVTRAAMTGGTTTVAGWASELVETAQADFLNTLTPESVLPRLAALGTALSFGPNAGAIKIPSRAATPSIGGSFVAEGAPIPVRRLGTTSITLYPHKMGGISVISRELAAYSNPQAEGIIRRAIMDDTAINADALLLDAVAVSTTRPAGLTNGVSALTATAGGGYAAILGDIKKLTNPFYAANAGRRLAMLINPAQGNDLLFAPGPSGVPFGWTDQFTNRFTVIESTSVTAGNVYMVDAEDFVSVTGAPEFEVSDLPTLHMEDTSPLQIATGAQGSGVLATPTQSMFQTAQIAIRMIANVNWAMRRAGMVQWISGVTWS